jgi:hypothetical protein
MEVQENAKRPIIKRIFSKLGVKYTVAILLVLVFALAYLFDFVWSKTYEVQVISISDQTPYADQTERVEITVQVKHFGKEMAGHSMFALPNAGRMESYTAKTDENGYATFVYIPHEVNKFDPDPILDVVIKIRDESNSVVWEVNAYGNVELTLKRGKRPK